MTVEFVSREQLEHHPLNTELYGETVPDTEMTQSIRDRGVLQSLRVTPTGASPGKLRIVSGHRREVNAGAAGLDVLPVEVHEYESEIEVCIDLIESNRQRVKTEAQKNAEIVRLKGALSDAAKARKTKGLKRGEDGDDSPLCSNEHDGESPGRTHEVIADKLGVSPAEVRRRMMVVDPEYRETFFDELATLGGDGALIEKCGQEWARIHRALDCGEVSVSKAATEVKQLQQRYRTQCPKFKKARAKKAKSVSASRSTGRPRKRDALFGPAGKDAGDFHALHTEPISTRRGADYMHYGVCIASDGAQRFAVQIKGKLRVADMHELHMLLREFL